PAIEWDWEPLDGTHGDAAINAPIRVAASAARSGLASLESAPMSAVHIVYRRSIDFGLPREHVGLIGSKDGITLVDLTQHWKLPEGVGSLLSIVASKTGQFEYVYEKHIGAMIADEVCEYIPSAKVDP